jgi:hypothetical protein
MKQINNIWCLLISVFFIACSPKIGAPLEETKEEVQHEEMSPPEEDTGPCSTFNNLDPMGKDQAETAYVLYKDQVNMKDYEAAYPLWKKAFTLAPAANGRVTYQFDDGIKIFDHFFQKASSEEVKKQYLDSIMSVYDKRIECLGDEAYVAGRKAFDYYYKYRDYTNDTEIFNLFKKALDEKGEKADYFILNPFSSLLYAKVLEESITKEEGSMYAEKVLTAVKYGTANCENGSCEAWEIINEYSPPLLENLEGLEDFYSCDYYLDKYYNLFQSNPESCDTINLVYRKFLWAKCDSTNSKVKEVKVAKNANCYVPPPPPGLLKQAYDLYTNGQLKAAVDKFEEFINNTDDYEKKAKYSLLIAKIYYGDLKNFIKSRQWANKAAEYKANWGEPFILIGKLYASSGPLCGSGRGFESQRVVWVAIDKFQYAKKIDPAVAGEANKWINRYMQYMPDVEDCHQRRLVDGESYFVPCWIQESTRVRCLKN